MRPTAPLAPKVAASEWLRNKAEVDFGSWSGLDETTPDKVGVGIFFKKFPDGCLRVTSLVPGSSAFRSGLIEKDDTLLHLDGEMVSNWKLHELRLKLHGPPGSFVRLELMRTKENIFTINLMRGSPGFMDFQDRFGVSNASQVDGLLLMKREEQKKNFQVEKCLKTEQAQFAEVQLARKNLAAKEASLREELELLQRQCYEEERRLELAQHELAQLIDRQSRRFCNWRSDLILNLRSIPGRIGYDQDNLDIVFQIEPSAAHFI